jgi:spore coat protein SA
MNKEIRRPDIAIITLADLPLPAVKGGAVETLIDNICAQNETEKKLNIDVFSITGGEHVSEKNNTNYHYYKKMKERRITIKNVLYKITGKVILNKTMRTAVSLINKKNYDLVIVTSIIKEIACFAEKCNSPVVWYLHGDAVEVLGTEWVYQITQKCAGVIAVSNFVANRVKETGAKIPIYTAKNCGDITRIASEDEEIVRKNVRTQYGINDEIVFAYVGRIIPIKGVRELVDAFTKAERKKTKLLIIGSPDPSNETYFSEIKKHSGENVVFTGYIPHNDLNKIYCSVDVVVVPSICNEAAPLTVVESQQCGKFVIAANRGGISEYAVPAMTDLIEGTGDSFIINLMSSIKNFDVEEFEKKRQFITKFTQENLYKEFTDAIFKIITIA